MRLASANQLLLQGPRIAHPAFGTRAWNAMHEQPPYTPLFRSTKSANASQVDAVEWPDTVGRQILGSGIRGYSSRLGSSRPDDETLIVVGAEDGLSAENHTA